MRAAYHFSHRPDIAEFTPHVAATAAEPTPHVWAIDADHAPAYWFPRQCPRVTFWPGEPPDDVASALLAGSPRVHAIEWAWLDRLAAEPLYRYEFDAAEFRAHADRTSGYLVADHAVRPVTVEPVGDVVRLHADAGIELRLAPSLWPLHDLVPATNLDFSIIRMRNAAPR